VSVTFTEIVKTFNGSTNEIRPTNNIEKIAVFTLNLSTNNVKQKLLAYNFFTL